MTVYLAMAAAAAALMTLAWGLVRVRGDGGWTDVVWSFAVSLVGAGAALWPADDAASARQLLVAVLVGGWALRLGGHLAVRTAGARRPDPRYERFKAEWGGWSWKAWRFLMIQAGVVLVLAISIRAAAVRPAAELDLRDALAVLIVLVAVGGEWLADRQLAAFRREPDAHGRVMDRGLWGWSRHPNYFFEWLVWLSWPVMALSGTVGSWPTLLAPLLMWWLLNHVSGVPMLEAEMLRSRPRAFRDYQARVSRFFPLPPKRT